MSFRRFEILLPLRFNDGGDVPNELIAETLRELRAQFGAVSCETQTTRGLWVHESDVCRDDLVRLYVDAPDSDESRNYFAAFKELLKGRFEQIDGWMTTYPIEFI
jgi:hypothetical protein